jgi:hypothetical protein
MQAVEQSQQRGFAGTVRTQQRRACRLESQCDIRERSTAS